jgi:hypothetical protein
MAGALSILILSTQSVAAASTATDPAGDALYKAPDYLDIVGAELTSAGGTFKFRMTVAAPIPAQSKLPPPASATVRWAFPIDSDPTTFPTGAPFAPGNGQAGPSEFNIRVFSDGKSFWASLLDRRPLLVGSEALLIPLAFDVSGAQVTVAVPGALLGAVSTFKWGAITAAASAAPDSNGGSHFIDVLQPFQRLWP